MPLVIISPFITKMLSIVISVSAITLYPFIILSGEANEYEMNHELIHYEQQKELYVVGFYFLYVYDYAKGMIKYKNKEFAYYQIRFEREAHAYDKDLGYIADREKYAWKNYEV